MYWYIHVHGLRCCDAADVRFLEEGRLDEAEAEKSIEVVAEIAASARKLGTMIVVTNPSPIRWGGEENKVVRWWDAP